MDRFCFEALMLVVRLDQNHLGQDLQNRCAEPRQDGLWSCRVLVLIQQNLRGTASRVLLVLVRLSGSTSRSRF